VGKKWQDFGGVQIKTSLFAELGNWKKIKIIIGNATIITSRARCDIFSRSQSLTDCSDYWNDSRFISKVATS
jgi:hypothetical protein